MKINSKTMIYVAMLIAVEVVLSRFCSIATPIMKIGFGFAPLAVCGMLFGPIWAALAGGLADAIGAILFPIGPFFPGFTLSAALSGAVFGLFLHGNGKTFTHLISAVAINIIFLSMLLSTYWLTIITGSSFLALLPTRAIQGAIMAPVQLVTLALLRPVAVYVDKRRLV
jgi:ECF transporter S component (folate family)